MKRSAALTLAPGAVGELALYIRLVKFRIVALLLLVALTSALVAAGGTWPGWHLVWLALGGGLASAGASVLNHYFDRDIDRLMGRTWGRPLPSGRLSPTPALLWGLLLVALSVPASLRLGMGVTALMLLGALVYVAVYTLGVKRRTPWNVVIGGLSGSCAVLAGWLAVNPALSPLAYLLAGLVLLWTPVHFWGFALVYRGDYQQAGVPMLPVVAGEKATARHILLGSTLVVVLSLALSLYFGWLYLAAALGLGALLMKVSWDLVRGRGEAWDAYKLSGPYLALLFLAMALDVLI